jgi:hypothetical protein
MPCLLNLTSSSNPKIRERHGKKEVVKRKTTREDVVKEKKTREGDLEREKGSERKSAT